MCELGIELADRRPKQLTRQLAEQADVVVTMGCADRCPYISDKRYSTGTCPTTKGQPTEAARATCDRIARRGTQLVTELDSDDRRP